MSRKIQSITAIPAARSQEELAAGDPPYEILALLDDGKTVVALISGEEFELQEGEPDDDGADAIDVEAEDVTDADAA